MAPTQLPPGPRLPSFIQTQLIWTAPEWFLRRCQRRYGDIFTVRAFPIGTGVYLADPAAVKEAFATDPERFRAGEAYTLLGPVLGLRSLLLLDGAEHLGQRRLMLPPFHGEAIQRYQELVREVVDDAIDGWPVGRPFSLQRRMAAITLEVILQAVIGVTDAGMLERLRPALRRAAGIGSIEMLWWLWPPLGRVGPWRRYRQHVAEADRLLREVIRDRQADPTLDERTDVLSLLIRARDGDDAALSEDDLRDQLMTLLMAGHETTATGLAWALERLMRTPDVEARAVRAARDGDRAYLEAVVQETLRLRPVIGDVARLLTDDADFAGYRLPARASVMPAIVLLHHDARWWPDPRAFRPERFLDAKPAPGTWIPFGGGTRRCLGAAFATMEMRITLETVLARCELEPARRRAERVRVRHITLAPSRGGRAVLRARRERGAGVDAAGGEAARAVSGAAAASSGTA